MSAIARTVTLLSIIVLWQCTFHAVDSRPYYPKKHTTSPSKHHRHSTGHSKNAISHPQRPASLRELALGFHKSSNDILPFHFAPTEKQTSKSLQNALWGTFRPGHHANAGPVVEAPAPMVAVPADAPVAPSTLNDNIFGSWGTQGATHTTKGTSSGHFVGGPFRTHGAAVKNPEGVGAGGAWGAFQPARHTATGGGTSKAIHMTPGKPPHIVEESIPDGGFETLASSSSDEAGAEAALDGWFMSFVPYPQPTEDTDDGSFMSFAPFPEPAADNERFNTESSSSSLDGMWGAFRVKKTVSNMSLRLLVIPFRQWEFLMGSCHWEVLIRNF